MSTENTNIETKFQSPFPILKSIRDWVLGSTQPDIYTRLAFYINLIITFLFLAWNTVVFIVMQFQDLILTHKTVDLKTLLEKQFSKAHIPTEDILEKMGSFNQLQFIIWFTVLFSSILLYRKKTLFIWFLIAPVLALIFFSIYLFNGQFFQAYFSNFDQIALLILILNSIFYFIKLNRELHGSSTNFFGLEDE